METQAKAHRPKWDQLNVQFPPSWRKLFDQRLLEAAATVEGGTVAAIAYFLCLPADVQEAVLRQFDPQWRNMAARIRLDATTPAAALADQAPGGGGVSPLPSVLRRKRSAARTARKGPNRSDNAAAG